MKAIRRFQPEEGPKRRLVSSSNLCTLCCSVQRRLPPQPHRDPVVLARRPLLQQRDALAAAAVRDGDEQGAHERLQGAVRLQRAPALHHREVGQPHQLSPGPHLLQQVSSRAANEQRTTGCDTIIIPTVLLQTGPASL